MNEIDIFKEIEEIYALIPASTCMKTSCSNECCTKKESPRDAGGIFMPLPLIYTAEYLYILDYLNKQFPFTPLETLFDFSKSGRLCPFKDPETRNCKIYEVRPFSCRMFGRKLPPVFWGMEVTEKQAEGVFCADLRIDEENRQKDFLHAYPHVWDMLAQLSLLESPFSPKKTEIIEKATGIPALLILSFGEFYKLCHMDVKEFEETFPGYWENMADKL